MDLCDPHSLCCIAFNQHFITFHSFHVSIISILIDSLRSSLDFGGWVGPYNKWHLVSWSLCLLSLCLLPFSLAPLLVRKQTASRARRWARFGQTSHRSYPCENTRSHPNSEVKHMWAGLVEWWVTTFESPVLKTTLFFFSFSFSFIFLCLFFTSEQQKRFPINYFLFSPPLPSPPPKI